MESIIRDDMVIFLEEGGLLNSNQHGFMKKRSWLTNLLETLEEWTKALDEGYGIDVIYVDYRKAFDSVPHKRLIEKLMVTDCTVKRLHGLKIFRRKER